MRSEEHKHSLDEHGSKLPVRREITLNLGRAVRSRDKEAPLIKINTHQQRRRVSSQEIASPGLDPGFLEALDELRRQWSKSLQIQLERDVIIEDKQSFMEEIKSGINPDKICEEKGSHEESPNGQEVFLPDKK